ncbi:hypothetical protein BSU01_23765 [Erwinia billingiae]|uniref:hypothetical protein n=1 Tax=Erwinia billingiae TaxID=182337 RepID=UPI0019CF94D8|nr:hypothetical protein [Erwinia billingiae]MBN7124691.1 hypothetical protein [Erwinia billingiae]
MKRNELVILVVLLILATLWPLFCNWYDNEYGDRKYEQAARSRPGVTGHYEPLLLSHRLVEFDRLSGIASEERASLAFGNTQAWFSDVRKQCIKSLSNQDYLACANQLLGRHFFYSPAQAVSDGWADHYSDCDLNAYLLMDAMHMAGREADILYAPHHAFISYRDEITREWLYWETTGKHNTGNIADLRLDLYRKTPSHFYYTPEPAAHAESIYPALVINKITPADKRHALLINLHQHYPDNPFVQDAWYEQKSVITREDAQLLLSLLKTDITSVSKRLLLVGYFLNQNEENKAKQVLSEISDEDCNGACLRLKSQQSVSYRFALWGMSQLRDLNVRISLSDFFASIRDSLILYALILLASGIYKAYIRWPITICRKNNPLPPQHPDNCAD